MLLLLFLAQPGQSEFVPIDQLPPADQLPAAPLLIAAYAFVWVAVFTYLLALWRRLGKVEREVADLNRQITQKRP
jgi:CcmD family protein